MKEFQILLGEIFVGSLPQIDLFKGTHVPPPRCIGAGDVHGGCQTS